MYYQYLPSRLATCTLTIHALLHIADCIEAAGPMWAYWAFPMERHCGSLVPAIRSRRFPFPSIDRYVTEVAQLAQVKINHGLHETLALRAPKLDVAGMFADEACEYQISGNIHIYSRYISRSDLCITTPLCSRPCPSIASCENRDMSRNSV
jgi:hypothetical protein